MSRVIKLRNQHGSRWEPAFEGLAPAGGVLQDFAALADGGGRTVRSAPVAAQAGEASAGAAGGETVAARPAGERERILAAAREEGYAVGLEEGRAAGRAEALEEARAAVAAVLAEAESLRAEALRLHREAVEVRDRALDGLQETVVQLVMETARRVLRREVSMQPEEIVRIAAGLVAEAREQDELTLLVSPGDAVLLEGQKDELRAGLRATQRLRIVPDAAVEPGGAVLETPGGTWDARLESQLQVLEAALREAVLGGA